MVKPGLGFQHLSPAPEVSVSTIGSIPAGTAT